MAHVGLDRVSFSGHETFPFRFAWLPKAVDVVSSDAQVFNAEDALVRFGVGKNMVRSIRHWGLATGVLATAGPRGRDVEVTPLGKRLFGAKGWDPYLEDPATLWLLHWSLASQGDRATTWFWVFNHCPQPEFTKQELLHWLLAVAEQHGATRSSEASLRRDIDVFIRTYVPVRASRTVPVEDTVDCPLVELDLLREFGGRGAYLLQRGDHPSLSEAVFAYALADFLGRVRPGTRTIALDELAYSVGAPGRVLCLTEDALLARMESLGRATNGAIVYDETAGMRQVFVKKEVDPMLLLEAHYRATVKERRR